MKKEVLFLTLLLVLSSSVFATDFVGWKYPGDKFTLNEDNFSIQLSKNEETLYMKYNSKSLILDTGECEFTSENYYYVCFGGTYVNFQLEPEVGKLDDRTGELIPGINITIKYRKPDIVLTRTFSKKDPFIKEKIEVTTTIENKGQNPAMVNYACDIPSGFNVEPMSGVGYNGSTVKYVASLGMGAVKTFIYTITPIEFVTGDFYGNLSYVYEGMTDTISHAKETVTVKESVVLTPTITTSLGISELNDLKFLLENVDESSIANIDLTVYIPEELTVKSHSNDFVEQAQGVYNFNSLLPKQDDKNIKITINTVKTGEFLVKTLLDYKVHDIRSVTQKNYTIKVISDKIEPSLDIEFLSVGSNQNFDIKGVIVNKDTDTPYYNLKMSIDSVFLKEAFLTGKIIQNQDITIFEREVVAPTLNEQVIYDVVFYGSYETINKEKFNFTLTKKVTVNPPSDTLVISHEFDKYTNESDRAKVLVFIENKREIPLKNVNIVETIPSNFQVMEGATSTFFANIEPKRKIQAYYYLIIAKEGQIGLGNVVTTVSFNETDRNFLVKQPLSINISGKTTKQEAPTTELASGDFDKPVEEQQQQENTQTQDTQTVAKKKWWEKIVDFLRNLI